MTRAREDAPRSGCPINQAVEIVGDSWTLIVLRDIVFGDRRYFRELLTGSEERIATNILADRLKRLVDAGLLTRETSGRGRRARYSLTEAGIRTVPILVALGTWGLDHTDGEQRLRVRAEVLRAGGAEAVDALMSDLRFTHLATGAPSPGVRTDLDRADLDGAVSGMGVD